MNPLRPACDGINRYPPPPPKYLRRIQIPRRTIIKKNDETGFDTSVTRRVACGSWGFTRRSQSRPGGSNFRETAVRVVLVIGCMISPHAHTLPTAAVLLLTVVALPVSGVFGIVARCSDSLEGTASCIFPRTCCGC